MPSKLLGWVLGMMDEIVVAVPVRNEVMHLPRLFEALAMQAAPPFTLVLFFDGCTDGGEELARGMAGQLPFSLVTSGVERRGPANVGLARGRACTLALAEAPDAFLLTTDADSAPRPGWVAASLAGLTAAEMVAGRIEPEPGLSPPLQQRLSGYLDQLHRHRRAIDPVSWEDEHTHHWTSAASLAFRPRMYQALGGFAPLSRGEDADLGDRAWRAGLRLRRDARVCVSTSARRGGRSDGGFAGLLAALDLADAAPRVAHPEDEAWRYRHHAWARRCWDGDVTDAFARAVRLDRAELMQVAAASPNAEGFTARVVGTPPGGMRSVTLGRAETVLDALAAGAMAGVA